jgi:sulfate permease, SulP family
MGHRGRGDLRRADARGAAATARRGAAGRRPRLRGHTKIGATFVDVLARYAELARAGGRLYLAGVDREARAPRSSARARSRREAAERIFEATPVVGEATERAAEAGRAWLVASSRREDDPRAPVS